jgi:hypothetical protein
MALLKLKKKMNSVIFYGRWWHAYKEREINVLSEFLQWNIASKFLSSRFLNF